MDGRVEMSIVEAAHYTNDDLLYNYIAEANVIWADKFGFRFEHGWINNINVLTDIEVRQTFPHIDFSGSLVDALNKTADAETEELILQSIAATFAAIYVSIPCRDPSRMHATYNNGEIYMSVNGTGYTSDRLQRMLGERFVVEMYDDDEDYGEDEFDFFDW
jgi:hypothetical protein